ncbi:MAG TPA: M28 family peptidase [Gemmatimonadaceae bacterium]|nr:M28 family peptidase [Gemmatimonadaceae bacterium]
MDSRTHPPLRGRYSLALQMLVTAILFAACAKSPSSTDAPVAPATGAAAATPTPASAEILPGDTLPRKYTPKPTSTAITPGDLMSRVYLFADDSMMGRRTGTAGGEKGTAYIAAELRRLGATPAGENGTFFQAVPIVRRLFDTTSSVAVDGSTLRWWTDFGAVRPQRFLRRSLDGVQAIYGGTLSQDTTALPSVAQMKGKLVVFTLPAPPAGTPAQLPLVSFQAAPRFSEAAGVALVGWEHASTPLVDFLRNPSFALRADSPPGTGPITLFLTTAAATKVLGADPSTLKAGAIGKTLRGAVVLQQTQAPARNVIAIFPGTDAALRAQYVALGAHSDHVGFTGTPVDHDSLRAFNAEVQRLKHANGGTQPSAAAQAQIRVNVDSLRRIRPARIDSVNNGADDDASGSMGLLEVAEFFADAANRPKRSLLFVWHDSEEIGLVGARWFTDNPTVPRDSIVGQLNVDMIGRGMPSDLPEGKPGYIQLLGSRRLSTEYGDIVEQVGAASPVPFTFDYQFDAPNHPEQYYCRSDHYMYARYGIPVVFLSTGDHVDYHQVTDEPQYINYAQLARVSTFLKDLAVRFGNLDHRVAIDKPKPDPQGQCRQ